MAQRKTAKTKACWWRYRLSRKLFWPLLIVLFLFFALSVFNFISLLAVQRDLKANLEKIEAGTIVQTESLPVAYHSYRHLDLSAPASATASITPVVSPLLATAGLIEGENFVPLSSEQMLKGTLSSFGDSFSGMAYINQAETDMFWDESITAFVFPPLYEIHEQGACSAPDCGLSRSATDPISICLSAGCLRKTEDLKLFFNDRELQLPPAIRNEELSSITLFALRNSWLIGLVSGPVTAERGWVYRFDGLSFSPLITDDTSLQITPRFQRGGGRIAFGGDDDDFLVLYAGYDGRAFRFRGSNQEDISKFFGLRVTDGGFWPQILKIGDKQDAIFYICSLTENKPKVIKIWSKDDLNSGGALDFSSLFFRGKLNPDSILCGLSDSASKSLMIAANSQGFYSLWLVRDLGFDNSRSRQVISTNLNHRASSSVKAAVIAETGVESLGSARGGGVSFSMANSAGNFENTPPFLWHAFESEGKELYWRFEAEPDPTNPDYSPWFDNINRLDYLLSD